MTQILISYSHLALFDFSNIFLVLVCNKEHEAEIKYFPTFAKQCLVKKMMKNSVSCLALP